MKKLMCIIISAAMLFSLTACKKDSKEAKNNNTAVSESIAGDTLTIYSLRDDTLCPIYTDNEANRQMLGIVYESLVRLTDSFEAEGVLADEWSVSEDGLNWTFRLKDGVKWHDGDAFTAQDVVYTINMIKLDESSSYYNNVRRIESAKAADGSVILTINEPCANFVNLMTFPIIKSRSDDIDRGTYVPCGTGAYVFSDENEGNMYLLKKNENWWGGEAKIDKIQVKLLPDSETVMYSFSSGDIDLADTERGQWGKFVSRDSVRTVPCSLSVYDFVGVNHGNTALACEEVRKAIDKVIDRSKIVDDIFAGSAAAANCPIRQNWFLNGDSETDYKADKIEAEKILTDKDWKKSGGVYGKKIDKATQKLKFSLIVNEENSSRINIAESIKTDMESIGMSVEIETLPYEDYESRIASGNYDLFIGSVMLSGELDFRFLLGEGNMFGYSDKNMDKILEKTQTAAGKENITARYGSFKKQFNSSVPIIGLCFENFDMLYNSRIEGELKSSQNSIYDGIFDLSLKGS